MVRRRHAMPSRPRTPRSDLDRLPQFEPDHTFRLNETQHESGLPFPESRARQIRDVLSSAMKDHVRKARFQGKSTSLERFLRNAMLAIATYESRSLRKRAYDRGRASKLLKEVRVALGAFRRALELTVEWKQLDRYLESLNVATASSTSGNTSSSSSRSGNTSSSTETCSSSRNPSSSCTSRNPQRRWNSGPRVGRTDRAGRPISKPVSFQIAQSDPETIRAS